MGDHPWMYPQWGLISKAGIPKPSYRAFELLNTAVKASFPGDDLRAACRFGLRARDRGLR